MKKKIIILFILSIFISNSQEFNGYVEYDYFANGQSTKTHLIFNKNFSLYKFSIIKKKDLVEITDNNSNDSNENMSFNLTINNYNNIPNSHGLLNDLKMKTIIEHKFVPKNINGTIYDSIYTKDKSKIIKWNIFEEYKKINNFNCQKAVGEFRGRIYHVWFTLDIPISYGPWKLNGLPGLILEAVDETKKFSFIVEKIEINKMKYDIDIDKFKNKNYITPIMEKEIFIIGLEKISDEVSEKIKSSLPRGVNSTTSKSKNIIDNNNLLEINFDDIE